METNNKKVRKNTKPIKKVEPIENPVMEPVLEIPEVKVETEDLLDEILDGECDCCNGCHKPGDPLRERMALLEMAYIGAIRGEVRFKDVKKIFKQFHKEIKKSVESEW